MSNPSVMNHQFSQIPSVEIPRSSFDRSHGLKTTFNASELIPVLCDEALPGDTFNLKMAGFARLATPIKPIMDNMFLETFFFAVPYRLVWENWQKFNGEQENPGDNTDFVIPQFTNAQGVAPQSLHDYMGIPPGVTNLPFNSLHARAYNLIWNEWFRDQNLQDSLPVDKTDGNESIDEYSVQRRGKRHDYFTSCLPWPQKGDAVELPIGNQAPVRREFGHDGPTFDIGSDVGVWLESDNQGNTVWSSGDQANQQAEWNDPGLFADLTQATAITVNQLRQGFQAQRMFERDARGGTRYTEIIRSHFGVISSDQRLQRPEFLGGGSTNITITPVAQTSSTNDAPGPEDSPQANLAAIGTSSFTGHGFSKSFTEHCLIIGLVNVRADLTYQQGLNRMFSRRTRFDYFFPSLANIGEQVVHNQEIFASPNDEEGQEPFGYQERYAEYRYKPSQITGKFRSSDPQSLDIWHLSQDFENLPVLNSEFIEDNAPVDRIIAVQDEPHFLFDAHFTMHCARPMPLYGVPGLIDHF